MNKILLVDDRDDFAQSFTQESSSRSITVLHKKSFQGLKELLPQHHLVIIAVVLDIRCLMTDEQEREDSSFIASALTYLDRNIPGFPRFILTGDDGAFEQIKGLFKDEKVFLKTPDDLDKLFIELQYCITNSDFLKLRRENLQVFEVFESGKMNDVAQRLLIQILKEGYNEKEFVKFKGVLANIRSFQESIYKTINARANHVVPDNMFKPNGMIKFNELMRHLNGGVLPPTIPTNRVYQNPTIFQLANSLYWSCGEYIHEDPNRNYFISHYTIKSLINNLLELVLWSKQY